MSNERPAPERRGVTVELLATVDLGPDIEGMAGRQLRMQGTITDHPSDGAATDYGLGVGWPEDSNTTHWLENRGTVPAVEISADIAGHE